MYRKDFEAYFGKLPKSGDKICCIWHEEKEPSLHLNYKTGKYKCYGCGKSGKIQDLIGDTPEISEETIEDFHDHLLKEPQMIAWLKSTKGINLETIKKYKIGHNGGRYCLPVKDKNDKYINLRLYSASSSPKMISYGEGYGSPAFFPFPPNTPVFCLLEGEFDTLLARQMGIPAFCQTAGAKTWNDKLTSATIGKKVVIVYDVDSPGINGAKKVLNAIKFQAKQVKNLRLPISGKSKDFSDWVLREGGTKEAFLELIAKTKAYVVGEVKATLDDVTELKMREAVSAKWAYKAVQTKVVVAGKDRAPYLIPKSFVIECPADKKYCRTCVNNSGQGEYDIEWEKGVVCQFVDVSEGVRQMLLKTVAGVAPTCKSCKINVKEFQNMEKLAIFEKKEDARDFEEMAPADNVLRKAYFMGEGIEANSAYRIVGIPIPDPRDQSSVFLVVEAEPIDNIEKITDTSLCEVFRLREKKNEKSKEASA